MIACPSARALHGALVAFFPLVLGSSAALAELPHHLHVQTLDPDLSVDSPVPGELADLHYGQAVVVRNGIAFISMTRTSPARVAVLSQTASGWVRTQTIEPPDPALAADFGQALAFRDGRLVVGSRSALYVYRRANGVWKLNQTILPPAAAGFGEAMWYEAGELVIGAAERSSPGGSVLVFETDSTGKFVQRAHLKPSDGHDRDDFGASVATTAGRTIVVGAPGESGQHPFGDAAYVFKRNAAHQWVQTQKLVPIDETQWQRFGSAVAMDKGMILVGAPFADPEGGGVGPNTDDGHVAQGAVYGFLPTAGQYVETFKLRPRPDELFDYREFGDQIAMFDKRIAVAANGQMPFGDHAAPAFIFTYSRSGNNVTPLGLAMPGLETATTSIWIANNWLLVGSPFKDCGPDGCPGQANVFDLFRFEP